MAKQQRSVAVMRTVTDAVIDRLWTSDETLIRIPEVCGATGVNYGSVYHHFGSREGVIDAAYERLFAGLIGEGVASLRQAAERSTTPAAFAASLREMVAGASADSESDRARAMRTRIVAAALVRPHLRERIGSTIAGVTDEVARIVVVAQQRALVRPDSPARALAAVLEALVFGRILEDVSGAPVAEDDWCQVIDDLVAGVLVTPDANCC